MARVGLPSRPPEFWKEWNKDIVLPCVQSVVRCNVKVDDAKRAHFEDVLSRIVAHRTLKIKEATNAEKNKNEKALLKQLVEQAKKCLVMLLTLNAEDVPQRLVEQKRAGHVDFASEWSMLEEQLYGRRKTRKGVSVRSLNLKPSARQAAAQPSADAATVECARTRQLEEENRRLLERAENAEVALAQLHRQQNEQMEQIDLKPASATHGAVASLSDTFTRSLVVSGLNDTELLQKKLHEVSGEIKHEVRDTTDRFCLDLLEYLPSELKQELMTYSVGGEGRFVKVDS